MQPQALLEDNRSPGVSCTSGRIPGAGYARQHSSLVPAPSAGEIVLKMRSEPMIPVSDIWYWLALGLPVA